MTDPRELIGHRVIARRREVRSPAVPLGTQVTVRMPAPLVGVVTSVHVGTVMTVTMTTDGGPVNLMGSAWHFRPAPTPYDTGERAEPTAWSVGEDDEDYGKVDFDDDAGETIATVWFERRDDGKYELVVDHGRDISIRMDFR